MKAGGPRSPTGEGALYGVYYAVVTQNKDDEKKCRVKIRLPWLDKGDVDQTHWAMVAAPMAGAQFGWYTLPDVGDVVAVMFVAGDVTRPVVLGGVWSKTDPPPEKNEGDNDFRGYRSRAGSRVVMDDSAQGKVYLVDKADKNGVIVGSFGKGGSGANAREAPKPKLVNGPLGQSGVSLFSMEGTVELTAKGKLTVTAQTHIDVVAEQTFDCKAQGNANFEAQGVMNCNGGPSAKLEGSQAKIN